MADYLAVWLVLLGAGCRAASKNWAFRRLPTLNQFSLVTGMGLTSAAAVAYMKPRLSLHEPLYVRRCWTPELSSFSTPHQGTGGYWMSPQRYQEVGSTWRDTRRRRVVFPGNTGFSDVPSTLDAGYCHIHPTLVWRYRWQKLRQRVPQVLKGRDNFLAL